MKMRFVLYTFLAVVFVALSIDVHQVLADGSCLTLNNGGTTTRQICVTPSPSNAPANQATNSQQHSQQNSNGQHVYPSTKTKTTPKTGPDDLSLLVLAAAGACGVLLRNKAKT